MNDDEYLARRFEENRGRLTAVAYRMLGSTAEADDAVQDAWLRLDRADADGVDNLPGWLTTVVARICLDRLRSRTSRREDPLDVGAGARRRRARSTRRRRPCSPTRSASRCSSCSST